MQISMQGFILECPGRMEQIEQRENLGWRQSHCPYMGAMKLECPSEATQVRARGPDLYNLTDTSHWIWTSWEASVSMDKVTLLSQGSFQPKLPKDTPAVGEGKGLNPSILQKDLAVQDNSHTKGLSGGEKEGWSHRGSTASAQSRQSKEGSSCYPPLPPTFPSLSRASHWANWAGSQWAREYGKQNLQGAAPGS